MGPEPVPMQHGMAQGQQGMVQGQQGVVQGQQGIIQGQQGIVQGQQGMAQGQQGIVQGQQGPLGPGSLWGQQAQQWAGSGMDLQAQLMQMSLGSGMQGQ